MSRKMKLSATESDFFSSVRAGDVSTVRQALRPEPYLVNFQDEVGKTPLLLAVEIGMVEMVKLLIAHGADLSVNDQDGNNLLYVAVEKCLEPSHAREKFIEIINILLASGISINSKNKKGFPACIPHRFQVIRKWSYFFSKKAQM